MCGIFGTFSFDGTLSLDLQNKKLELLKHRGPDGYGYECGNYFDGQYDIHYGIERKKNPSTYLSCINYFLGHRRLSIIDLDTSASQPMESLDNNYSIIFNGEIYNYIELKEELIEFGCEFKTDHSDTEILLNAYLVWGEKCLQKLRGMFAFAIFDRVKKVVFIARDRIGQKSVYYEFNDHGFTFSSEIPPIVRHSDCSRNINLDALSYYTLFGYVPSPLSIFDGINKLPPATYAILDLNDNSFSVHEYWDVFFDLSDNGNVGKYESLIEDYLSESVKLRLRADVPVGAFISGGIDSSLIVKKISEVGKTKFDIFGADFPQPEKSELKYIEQASSRYGQRLNISNIDIDHIKNIKSVLEVFDEPFDGGSSVSLYELFKQASVGHKVILTGDGGDEIFAGYERYQSFPKRFGLFSILDKLKLPKMILRTLVSKGKSTRKLSKLSRVIDSNIAKSYLNYDCDMSILKLLKHEIGHNVMNLSIFDPIMENIDRSELSQVKSLQYLELKTILPGRMLYKLDRFSMAYSVEARSPFLDHSLIEMAFSIPDQFNINESGGKVLLKNILEKDFPLEFIHRKKKGFGNPFSAWFSQDNIDGIYEIVNSRSSKLFRYFDYDSFHQEFPQFKSGYKGEREKEMWRFIVLANYLDNYSDVIAE